VRSSAGTVNYSHGPFQTSVLSQRFSVLGRSLYARFPSAWSSPPAEEASQCTRGGQCSVCGTPPASHWVAELLVFRLMCPAVLSRRRDFLAFPVAGSSASDWATFAPLVSQFSVGVRRSPPPWRPLLCRPAPVFSSQEGFRHGALKKTRRRRNKKYVFIGIEDFI
jgi:hypothetical protein